MKFIWFQSLRNGSVIVGIYVYLPWLTHSLLLLVLFLINTFNTVTTFSVIVRKHFSEGELELDVVEDSLAEHDVLAEQLGGIRRVWN